MDGLKAVESVYVAGQWRDATWLAEVVDPETGELVLTATVVNGQAAPVVSAVRLTGAMLRELRRLAGFSGPLPVDEARAELAYWRESVQFAVGLLEEGRQPGRNIVTASGHAQEYLRQLLELGGGMDEMDGGMDGPCYDCRTTEQRVAELEIELPRKEQLIHGLANRLAALEAAASPAIANRAWMDAVESNLDTLGEKLVDLEDKLNHVAGAVVMDAVIKAMREQDGA